jgi:hypothetical protein
MAFICDHAKICGTKKSTFDAKGKIEAHGECAHNEPHNDMNCSNRRQPCMRVAPNMPSCIEIVAPVVQKVIEVIPEAKVEKA